MNGHAVKVLMVDDEKDLTSMVKLNLERDGRYEVAIENDPTRALAVAKKAQPEVIILDILMPRMDGFKVLELLKKERATVAIPVIMMTAVRTDDAKTRAAQLYDESYLEKPVSAEDLMVTIEKVLRRRARA